MRRVLVTNGSQPHVLRHRLGEAGVGHGQQVEAQIEVRVEGTQAEGAAAAVFFCNMPPLEDYTITGDPDGQELPEYAVLLGMQVAQDGYYRVPVNICPNGTMTVTVTGEPVLVGHDAAAPYNGDGWQGHPQHIRIGG